MLRSLSAAVSGLRNHQVKLDVIGNNIANVNTVGYKYDTVRFQDLFSQTLRGATAPLGGRGGINPMQVGLGMAVSSIDTVHTEGAITGTGRETDLAIEGRGFFVVSDGQQNYYTRDGSFARDLTGVLTNANSLRLMGWILEEGQAVDTSQPLQLIHIPLGEEMLAKQTENVILAGNLNSAGYYDLIYNTEVGELIQNFSFRNLPQGEYELVIKTPDSGEQGRVIESISSANFELDISTSADVMHFVEVVGKVPGEGGFIKLRVLELDKNTGKTQSFEFTAGFDSEDAVYKIAGTAGIDDLQIDYDGSIIGEEAAVGDKFLLDFAEGNAQGTVLRGIAGGARGQEISLGGGSLAEGEHTFYTMFMDPGSGALSSSEIKYEIVDNTSPTDGLAVSFGFEPCGLESHVFDSLGNRHVLDVNFTKSPNDNEWYYTISHSDIFIGLENNTGKLVFTEGGHLDAANSEIHSFTFDPKNGAAKLEINPNFMALTQLASQSNVMDKGQDGFPPGELATFNIGETGVISGTYTNGVVRDIAQLALANFANPEGLLKMGSNLYNVTSNSGEARIGLPGMEGRGLMKARSLEMSNVDLANEFTEMITTSRAFQANTRMISTSDEVLMELINIKR